MLLILAPADEEIIRRLSTNYLYSSSELFEIMLEIKTYSIYNFLLEDREGIIERIFAFIDSQNLNLGTQKVVFDRKTNKCIFRGWKLDFKRFFVYLQDKYRIEKAFIFIGKVSGNEPLYKYLEESGYQLIFKPTMTLLNEDGDIETKGNVDAELVLHSMIEYDNYDKAIIVTGDGDYHCLLEYLETQNKLYKLLIPNKYRYSRLLRRFLPFIDYVSDIEGKLKKR